MIRYNNALFLSFKTYLLDSRNIDSSVAKVAQGDYFMGWLSLDSFGTEWRLNLLHLLQNPDSQELHSEVIINNGFCLDVYFDYVSPRYLEALEFLVFCVTYERYPVLY